MHTPFPSRKPLCFCLLPSDLWKKTSYLFSVSWFSLLAEYRFRDARNTFNRKEIVFVICEMTFCRPIRRHSSHKYMQFVAPEPQRSHTMLYIEYVVHQRNQTGYKRHAQLYWSETGGNIIMNSQSLCLDIGWTVSAADFFLLLCAPAFFAFYSMIGHNNHFSYIFGAQKEAACIRHLCSVLTELPSRFKFVIMQ